MASKYLQKYPVPEEFPDLLHDFAREVLRDQPENIYEYGALYFKHMYMVSQNTLPQNLNQFLNKLLLELIIVTYMQYERFTHILSFVRVLNSTIRIRVKIFLLQEIEFQILQIIMKWNQAKMLI